MRCARCNADVGNGGVDRCSPMSILDKDAPGGMRVIRFCQPCTDVLLTAGKVTRRV